MDAVFRSLWVGQLPVALYTVPTKLMCAKSIQVNRCITCFIYRQNDRFIITFERLYLLANRMFVPIALV